MFNTVGAKFARHFLESKCQQCMWYSKIELLFTRLSQPIVKQNRTVLLLFKEKIQ